MSEEKTLLVIDDDPLFNRVLSRSFASRGYVVTSALDADHARSLAEECQPAYAVLDLNLGGASGLTLVAPLLAANPACRIVVLTGYASIATAVEAIKLGAAHYLAKPTDVDAILAAFDTQAAATPIAVASSPLSVERLEWEHIQRVLHEHQGNISATARALNMHRRTLQRKLIKRSVRR